MHAGWRMLTEIKAFLLEIQLCQVVVVDRMRECSTGSVNDCLHNMLGVGAT